jgi:fused signal recognition particle receptor
VAALLSRWREGLTTTSQRAFGRLVSVQGASEITDSTWDELEEILIQADVSVSVSQDLFDSLRRRIREHGLHRASDLGGFLRLELRPRFPDPPSLDLSVTPFFVLVVGVNGSGKTTSIAKFVRHFQQKDLSVLLGAAGTFRGAATEQLGEWARRLNVDMISGAPDSDPAAVAFNALQAGLARGAEVIVIDTAGRLQTRQT